MYLSNDSGSLGYCAVQMAKGRIIVIDNELFDGMIINRRYVLAHTSNIALKRPYTNPHNNGNLDFLLANLALGGAADVA